jgi:hypothetical protein
MQKSQETKTGRAASGDGAARIEALTHAVHSGTYAPNWRDVAEYFILKEYGLMECLRVRRSRR